MDTDDGDGDGDCDGDSDGDGDGGGNDAIQRDDDAFPLTAIAYSGSCVKTEYSPVQRKLTGVHSPPLGTVYCIPSHSVSLQGSIHRPRLRNQHSLPQRKLTGVHTPSLTALEAAS